MPPTTWRAGCWVASYIGTNRDLTFGTGAATNSIDEIPLADCLLVIGANPNEAHPVTGAKIKQRAMRGVPLILIDPRAIELAPYAAVHLAPRPGTNVALLSLLARELIEQDLVGHDFVARRPEGFTAFRAAVLVEGKIAGAGGEYKAAKAQPGRQARTGRSESSGSTCVHETHLHD